MPVRTCRASTLSQTDGRVCATLVDFPPPRCPQPATSCAGGLTRGVAEPGDGALGRPPGVDAQLGWPAKNACRVAQRTIVAVASGMVAAWGNRANAGRRHAPWFSSRSGCAHRHSATSVAAIEIPLFMCDEQGMAVLGPQVTPPAAPIPSCRTRQLLRPHEAATANTASSVHQSLSGVTAGPAVSPHALPPPPPLPPAGATRQPIRPPDEVA